MLLKNLETLKKPTISFEFFPPKTESSKAEFKEVVYELAKYNPSYVSVTYGAGGTDNNATYDLVKYIKENSNLEVVPHLTCVGATKDVIDNIAKQYLDLGLNKIVALRGDMQGMQGKYKPYEGGYAYANDLVTGLMKISKFKLYVAAYPEAHPEAISLDDDLKHLKSKFDAGAEKAITQYCFDTDKILQFIDKAKEIGITAPIIPGIVVISNFNQVANFSKRCGAAVPNWLKNIFSNVENNKLSSKAAAIMVAYEQCRILMENDVDEFHFYTLNKHEIVASVCDLLGLGN